MLGTLDESQPAARPQQGHLPSTLQYMRGSEGLVPQQPVECTVMTAKVELHKSGSTSQDSWNSPESSVQVTPLPSDVLDSDRSDIPLTMSQLKMHEPAGKMGNLEGTGAFQPTSRGESPLRTIPPPENARLAWGEPAGVMRFSGKENQPQSAHHLPRFMCPGMPLLRLPNNNNSNSRREPFPSISRRTSDINAPATRATHVPLLKMGAPNLAGPFRENYNRYEFPERDTDSSDRWFNQKQQQRHDMVSGPQRNNIRCFGPPMPLLRMPNNCQQVGGIPEAFSFYYLIILKFILKFLGLKELLFR